MRANPVAWVAASACAVACVWGAPPAAAEQPTVLFAPAEPTDSQTVFATILVHGAGECAPWLYPPVVDSAKKTITLFGFAPDPPGACPRTSQEALGQLRPGEWTVEVIVDEQVLATGTLTVVASPPLVIFGTFGYFETHYRVEVEWVDPFTGATRHAPGLALSDRAAQFWFFDARNPEVTLKILDGTAINGHRWLFASSMTSVAFTLRATACVDGDPPYCASKEYHSPAGANLDVVDLEAF